jgi:hypothetical protein
MTFTARFDGGKGFHSGSIEDWGNYAFVSLPSPGDRIAAEYDGTHAYLTVILRASQAGSC